MGNLNLSEPSFIDVVDDSSFSRDGLVLHLDASDWYSYPRTGTTWKDLSGKGRDIAILSTAYNGTGPKYMDFNGSYGCAKFQTSDWIPGANTVTAIVWTRMLRYDISGTCRTLFRALSSGGNHYVIGNCSGWNIGFYENDSGTGWWDSGYSQQSLPGYNTGRWNMLVWRYQPSSPYYRLTINDTPSVTSGQLTDSRTGWGATRGICSIGAYNNGNQNDCSNASQYWGDIGSVMMFRRVLSDSECLGHYQARKNRFGL